MAEYIEREAVKNALLGWDYDPSDDDIEFAIDNIPTVDVVEVVRCKDCKHCEFFYSACDYDGNLTEDYYCNPFRTTKKPTDFCSYGERKDTN